MQIVGALYWGVREMFTVNPVQYESKAEMYAQTASMLAHLIDGEHDEIANLSNCSALLDGVLDDINWVGFYRWNDSAGQLILGPFQGKPACIRIDLGKGVCGTAAQTRKAQVVTDVFAFPGHIACDPDSRSEVVIPLVKDGRLVGVLDIDAPHPNRFDDEDAAGLERMMEILLGGTHFDKS